LHQTFGAFGPQGLMLNEVLTSVKMAMAQGVHDIFLFSVGLTILSIITLYFLKEIPLRGGWRHEKLVVEVVEDALAEENGPALVD
jgi:hypothetical protein